MHLSAFITERAPINDIDLKQDDAMQQKSMKAVGYERSLPLTEPDALMDIMLPQPAPSARDLLVQVQAVSVNPVDAKMRMRSAPPPGERKVLGWDAVTLSRSS